MAELTVRAPTRADAAFLATHLRDADRVELEAGGSQDVLASILTALRISPQRWAACADGELVLLGGVSCLSILDGTGSPWLLGTAKLERLGGALTRLGVQYRDTAQSLYPTLINFVDARNVKSIRWLKRLGFTVANEPTPRGPLGLPFYRFELKADHV